MGIGDLVLDAIKRLYRESGLSIASAVAFSFIIAIFPFFVFIAQLGDTFGFSHRVVNVINQFLLVLPQEVRNTLLPEIEKVIATNNAGLLTVNALLMLFFASSGIESLRGALNHAYRDTEYRSTLRLRLQAVFFIFESAFVMFVLGVLIWYAPNVAKAIAPYLKGVTTSAALLLAFTYLMAFVLLIIQLFIFHIFLPAGRRKLRQVWPGILLCVIFWIILATGFSLYTSISSYDQLYGGFAQIIVTLVFFQLSAVIIILGACYNQAIIEEKVKVAASGEVPDPV